ncbi:MAG: hypothetical protein IJI83_03020 [Oscillospiraceae bacterium]|nr:hypothetical protein [Oscillospiraceae bacterium]
MTENRKRILTYNTFPNRSLMSKEELKRKLRILNGKLDLNEDEMSTYLCDLSDADLLSDLEYTFLYLYLQVCYAQEERMWEDSDNLYRTKKKELSDSLPCRVHYSPEYRALLIDTAFILKSGRTQKGVLQENISKCLVDVALQAYETEKGISFVHSVKAPYAIWLLRRCTRDQNRGTLPDIDNIEARKIINRLVYSIGSADSIHSFICNVNTIEYVDSRQDCGTSILLIQEDKTTALMTEFLTEKRSLNFLR